MAYWGGAKLGKDLERGGMGEPLLCLWVFWGWRLRWTQRLPSPPVHASISSGPRASESWLLDHQAVLWSPGKIPLESLVCSLNKLWPDTHVYTGREATGQDPVPAVLEDQVVGPYLLPVASHKPGWLVGGGVGVGG